MSRRTPILLFALMCSVIACAESGAGTKDLLGDPLPKHAVARLGQLRWVHGGKIEAIAYSHDGKLLASAGGKLIRIFDAENGREIRALEGHRITVRALAFVKPAKGKPCTHLVSGGHDGAIRIWELATGKEERIINQPGSVGALAISDDGTRIASGNYFGVGNVYVWNFADGKQLQAWQAHAGFVFSLAFSPNGKRLVSGGQPNPPNPKDKKDDYALAVWNPANGEKIHQFSQQDLFVRTVAFSPTGEMFASAGIDTKTGRSIRLWDAMDFKEIRMLKALSGQGDDARGLTFSPDGSLLAAPISGTREVLIWNVARGTVLQSIPKQKDIEAVAFSPDGKTLASAGGFGYIGLWDIDKRQALHPLPDYHSQPISGLAMTHDGAKVVTCGLDGAARLWDVRTAKLLREFRLSNMAGFPIPLVWSGSFAPDDKVLALSHGSQGISLWNAEDGKLLRQIGVKNGRSSAGITDLTFAPDGKTLASEQAFEDVARVWNPENGAVIRTFQRDRVRGTSVAYSGDGKWLASAADQVYVWNAATGEMRLKLPHAAGSIAYSKNGKLLASASAHYQVKLWDAESGKELATFPSRVQALNAFRCVAFSPDNRYLAVAELERVCLYDVATHEEALVLVGHRGPALCVVFSDDGTRLISAGEDCTALVWDVPGALRGKK
jgi:WD40 repeat protein